MVVIIIVIITIIGNNNNNNNNNNNINDDDDYNNYNFIYVASIVDIIISLTNILFLIISLRENKAYMLQTDIGKIPVYCHMTSCFGACGGAGWTLVMKIDGSKV